jgi:hypothetical protein
MRMIVAIERNDGSVEEMSAGEFTRWACMMEAFDFIQNRADQLGLANIDIKPLAIEKYIEERSVSMLHDVQCEIKLGLL